MPMHDGDSPSSELLPGTLDMLILKTLTHGAAHGYAIARHLERVSGDVLRVGESSLYPALQRLFATTWPAPGGGEPKPSRPARTHRSTPAGRRPLPRERR